ncbi:MAG: prolyl oligopeptidase family serine peptidase [Pirellulales bacterium]|nr:prolyl oligopeptidase family serine peptidase [Pirellulales bacterium]
MRTSRMILRTLAVGLTLGAAALSACTTPAVAQVALDKESYLEPPSPILDSVSAPWHTNVSLSNLGPDGVRFLLQRSDGMTSLEALANPHRRLAESDYEHEAQRSRRLYTRSNAALEIFNAETGETTNISLPAEARVSNATWSPDGSQIAFFAHFPDATHIYMASSKSGKSRQLTPRPVVATHVTSYEWTADGKRIVTVIAPDSEQVSMPVASPVATEPTIRRTREGNTPSRTYRYLLQSPYEMELLEYLSIGQLAVIDVDNGKVKNIGEPEMIRSLNVDPSGSYFRVTMLKKPFSYFVPMGSFGTKEILIDRQGDVLHTFSDRRLRDGRRNNAPARSQSNDDDDDEEESEPPRRDVRWRPGVKGMSFLQKAPKKKEKDDEKDDQGNGRSGRRSQGDDDEDEEESDERDRVMLWKPPFGDDDVEVVFESPTQIRSVAYSQDGRWMFLTRGAGRNRQNIHAVDLNDDNKEYRIFRGRGSGGGGGRRGGRERLSVDPESALDSYAWDYSTEEIWEANRAWNDNEFNAGLLRQDVQDQKTDDDAKQDDQKKDDDAKQDGDDKDADSKDGDKQDDDKQDDNRQNRNRGVSRGTLMSTTSIDGERVVRVSPAGDVYFQRTATLNNKEREEGDDEPRPRYVVIEKLNILSGKVEEIFSSEPMTKLTVSFVAAGGEDDLDHFYTSRQSTNVVPDFFMYVHGEDDVQKLTNNKNFTPWFQKLETERFQVTRVDGFKFWVSVTKNPDHGEKLPAMFWFYPREYTDQRAYDRGRGGGGSTRGPGRFRQPSRRSMAHLTQLGYVVVEPDLPIVGPEGRMNDNYVPDLRNGLWAVIDELDKRNIIDRDRLGIGGHSYGAFGTANAMAHTPFFKAGIAGDGNYNRTLTPMAFQSERRYIWSAREVYIGMSPMLWANQVNGALLMYHGAEDANVGTHPINSERMFHVLDGLGKPAAMYMYPYEDHGPIGKETTLDMWARWVAWLDKYVKNAGSQEEETEDEAEEDIAEFDR